MRSRLTLITRLLENRCCRFAAPRAAKHEFYGSEARYFYRGEGKPEPLTEKCAHAAMLLSWTWLFYQFINNGYTMLGEDVFPDSSTFTDSELGIE
ncbi:hypothetical protein X801_04770 [Opisthorchis viverrini]|uniref:Uncharacterized protein n=2 Tax=Opisthorchis viverrini TaxID=6198 RepID=A0A1S8WYB2_OPIVI|nr:hypothetical protein T265_09561 [Opisthorchis viverrini]KER22316.1 hypothetical protein T265_09561 [Opisthorchis viverrini]OON19365.1 hypothetical protein X801_04770 [Opisthorchis viverrini]